MALLRSILVNGGWYPQVEPPTPDAKSGMYLGKVRRPSGAEAAVYGRTAGGPFFFHSNAEAEKRMVFVIRHGATALNAESGDGPDRIRGWTDVPLSDTGHKEVAKLGDRLRNSGLDHLYHSDLIRAAQTAEAVSKSTGAPMTSVHDLRPWHVGVFSGQESAVVVPEMRALALNSPDEPIPGGESFNQFSHRIFCILKQLLLNDTDQQIGIVTHHRVERLVKAWITNGAQPDGSIDQTTMFSHGEKPGSAEKVKIDLHKLNAVGSV